MTYTIIAGVNGVGKSSFVGATKDSMDFGVIIDADRITKEAGVDAFHGGKLAIKKIHACIERGISFTQETTLSGHHILRTARKVRELGYQIHLYYIGLDSAEESVSRIENRVRRGGHDVPSNLVQNRFVNRWTNLVSVLPYCDRAIFYDNDNGFVEVARYIDGELIPIGFYRPKWVDELAEFLRHQAL